MPFRRKLLLVAALASCGCGYVGDPRPPALDIPRPVTDLRVKQVASEIVVEFTVPELTTEDLPLRLKKAEVLGGPFGREPFDAGAWAARALRLDAAGVKPGPVRLTCPAEPWVGQEVFFRVRLIGHRGRDSGWSDFVILRVAPPLGRPTGLKAEVVPQGVLLRWEMVPVRDGLRFRIWRRSGEGEAAAVAVTGTMEWLDSGISYGEVYHYSVQAVLTGQGVAAEGALSETVAIQPEDRFPPAAPSGLAAVAGVSAIELSWERGAEEDLAGYYVYRSAGGGPFERISQLLLTPSFGDRDLRHGASYLYAVTAVDRAGNESGRTVIEVAYP